MIRKFLAAMAVTLVALTGCSAQIGALQPIEPLRPGQKHAPITLSMWSFHTGPEAKAVQSVLDRLHREHPWLTVKLVTGKTDFSVLQGIYSGNPPDLAVLAGPANVAKFCVSGAMPDLNAVARKDSLALTKVVPPQVLKTASYQGKTCALPWLTDAYGLYYNKEMFRKAGLTHPPRSLAELETMGQKLTTYNPDGSIKVAGFMPISTFYHTNHMNQGPTFGSTWYDANGKSTLGTDPSWVKGLTWQKKYIDSIGYGKLQKFAAQVTEDSEYTPKNAFQTGKVAMILDGEWRVGYLSRESKVEYGTAPFPALDPARYGSGQIGGTMISMPAAVRDPAASWFALKYLALNTGALDQVSDGLQNIPTTFDSLRTSRYSQVPANKAFINILADPRSEWKQPTPAGQVDIDLLTTFVESYESGKVPDLRRGLRDLADDINAQIAVR